MPAELRDIPPKPRKKRTPIVRPILPMSINMVAVDGMVQGEPVIRRRKSDNEKMVFLTLRQRPRFLQESSAMPQIKLGRKTWSYTTFIKVGVFDALGRRVADLVEQGQVKENTYLFVFGAILETKWYNPHRKFYQHNLIVRAERISTDDYTKAQRDFYKNPAELAPDPETGT